MSCLIRHTTFDIPFLKTCNFFRSGATCFRGMGGNYSMFPYGKNNCFGEKGRIGRFLNPGLHPIGNHRTPRWKRSYTPLETGLHPCVRRFRAALYSPKCLTRPSISRTPETPCQASFDKRLGRGERSSYKWGKRKGGRRAWGPFWGPARIALFCCCSGLRIKEAADEPR